MVKSQITYASIMLELAAAFSRLCFPPAEKL